MNHYFALHTLEGEWHALLPRYRYVAERAEGRRVLDIGCGSGLGAALLAKAGADSVDAIDHRPAVIDIASGRHEGAGVDFHVMFPESLDFPEASFDLIVCLDPASPITDPNLLREVRRLLADGGEYACAIERRPIDGLERVLPRYGYTQPSRSIGGARGGGHVPQLGELTRLFAHTRVIAQRPLFGFTFAPSSESAAPDAIEDLRGGEEGRAGVEIWVCADRPIEALKSASIALPYEAHVERIGALFDDLQARQTPASSHGEGPRFDELLEAGEVDAPPRPEPSREFFDEITTVRKRPRLPAQQREAEDRMGALIEAQRALVERAERMLARGRAEIERLERSADALLERANKGGAEES